MGLGPLGSRNLSTDSIGFLEVPKPPMDILELLGQQSQTCFICPVYHHEASCDPRREAHFRPLSPSLFLSLPLSLSLSFAICIYIITYISRSAARLTRHRAFDFGGGRQVGELKNQPKMNPKTTAKNVMTDKWANAKSNQK